MSTRDTGTRGTPAPAPSTATIDEMIAAIRSGPRGAGIGAVFDLTALAELRSAPAPRWRGPDRGLAGTLFDQLRHTGESSAADILERAVRDAAGRTPDELTTLGERLFERGWYDRLRPELLRLVREHIAAGHTVVMTGDSAEFQLRPAATALGIPHVVGTRPAVAPDGLTGLIEGEVAYGPEKAAAVSEFAAVHGMDLGRSHVYSGSAGDLLLLSRAGTQVPVAPDPVLAATAAEYGWVAPVVAARTGPRPADYLRTLLGLFALLGGALYGVLRKSYTRDRRAMADALMKYGTAWPLWLCGIRLRVTGTENARGPRPAVFLFNHQSQFDVLIVPAVLGGNVTGVGKKELIRHPIFGPLMRFVGVTFIDRSNTDLARASLAPVVDTLRAGLSVAIAPEGTRSYTAQPGRFKKGAFHMAEQAGVPVIPVVIRNAADIGRRDSMIARSGVVDVAILPPIHMGTGELEEKVAEVRQRYLDTLRDWPR
ncbi:1-acylglycerol-3-phosphate O-acyltransferase [Nocardia sp. NBC_01329]|uniref:1-acylglycerol-3-phosphate O-acyltransferase n=1 Tax=Nocardia sp. NBC_01329 TaxID=2903594 RepID=UPI002E12D2A8|nr:1-acylglycerol-3-phosphate O-acyltransferase [Nocardia sp. NBC_01329]